MLKLLLFLIFLYFIYNYFCEGSSNKRNVPQLAVRPILLNSRKKQQHKINFMGFPNRQPSVRNYKPSLRNSSVSSFTPNRTLEMFSSVVPETLNTIRTKICKGNTECIRKMDAAVSEFRKNGFTEKQIIELLKSRNSKDSDSILEKQMLDNGWMDKIANEEITKYF
jgi:hypothetical protein